MILLLAAALSVPAAPERKVPEFRADVRLIRLDVSVVDKRGQPVAGLLPEHFRVTEDGRPVEVTFFEAVADAPPSVPGPPDEAAGEEPPTRRRILLLVDTGAMAPRQVRRARQAAAAFIAGSTTEGDWLRLVNLATGQAWDGTIPADRRTLEAAARGLGVLGSPWSEGRVTSGIEETVETALEGLSEAATSGRFLSQFAQAAGLLGTLESLLVQLDGVAGRKAVVLVSPGFPPLLNLDRRLQRVSTLARQAATAIYFVDVFGLDGLVPEGRERWAPAFELAWNRSGGAQDLAEATGGFTFRFSNTLVPALARIAAELRTYYVIGYVPPRPNDGRFRSVDVRMRVPGVTARTKKGYIAAP